MRQRCEVLSIVNSVILRILFFFGRKHWLAYSLELSAKLMGVPTCNFDSMSCYDFHHCRVYRGSYPAFYYRMTYARTLITLELLPHGALKTCTGFVGSNNYVAYGRVFLRNRTRYLSTSRDWLLCC